MQQPHNIFIALDDYDLPNPVVEYGAHLARALNAHAKLVAIEQLRLELAPGALASADIYHYETFEMGDVLEMVKPRVEALAERARAIWHSVSFSLEAGFKESTLVEKSEEEHPRLVLVQRRSSLTTLNEWFGTHETRLAESIPEPVLIVPQQTTWAPVRKILYVMDLDDHALENMRVLHRLAAQLSAELTVAIVSAEQMKENNPAFEAAVAMFRQLSSHEQVHYIQVFTDHAAATVESLAHETAADWLAFQDKDKSFLRRIFDSYNNEHFILHSDIPVLVL